MKYYFGIKKMSAAREKAESALGSRFDEKEYYAFLMDIGIADFDTLDKWEDLWIEKVLAAEESNEENGVQAADNNNPATGTEICFGYLMICAAAVVVSRKKKVK